MEPNITEQLPDILCELAAIIRRHWHPVHATARPYVEAMFYLKTMQDNYFGETANSVVIHFLDNAKTWKGDLARAVKAKLNQLAKEAA